MTSPTWTLRQWDRGADPGVPGVEVIAVGPQMALYTPARVRAESRRRWCSAPGFSGTSSVMGVGTTSYTPARFRTSRCWPPRRPAATGATGWWSISFEVWTRGYWREYTLGRRKGYSACGFSGSARACHSARSALSRLYAERLRAEGLRGEITLLAGIYAGPIGAPDVEAAEPAPAGIAEPTQAGAAAEPVVVFAGRHIPEKRVPSIVPAIALARAGALPGLRAEILGDGPERSEVLRLVDEFGLGDSSWCPDLSRPRPSSRRSWGPCAWCCLRSARGMALC